MKRFIPIVTRSFLILLAGYTWICVGLMLIYRASSWLYSTPNLTWWIYVSSGIFLAFHISYFGFRKIVNKNLKRIQQMDEKTYITSFIHKKSYLLILIMIVMGSLLRHSSIPKQYLAILYIAIGSALILSSVRYLRACIADNKF